MKWFSECLEHKGGRKGGIFIEISLAIKENLTPTGKKLLVR
jgi:hypothetical protein